MLLDIAKVWFVSLATLGICKTNLLALAAGVRGADIKLFLECVLITVTILYTLYKMRRKKDD